MSDIAPLRDAASAAVVALFKRHFGHTPPHVVKVPGSVEWVGQFTHLADGLSLSAAIDRFAWVAIAPRPDGRIELIQSEPAATTRFWLTELGADSAATWAAPFKQALAEFRERGVHFTGFNAAIHNEIPPACGLGERTGLALAGALAVRRLHPFGLGVSGATVPPRRDERGRLPALPVAEKLHLARLVAAALSRTGESPHRREAVTALLGRAWHLLAWDHRLESVDHLPLIGEALVLCPSGVQAGTSGPPEAELRASAAAVRAKLGTKSLRAVELKSLSAARAKLSAREYALALYLVGENTRAVAGERWLRADDHRQFGQLLWQSHDSQQENLRGTSEELDALVALARTFRGALGARASGGCATLNLVAHHEAQGFCTHLAEGYERLTAIQVAPRVCQLVDGSGH